MALKPAAHSNVTGHTNLEASQEALRVLLGQIEAELYQSDTYRRALASFETLLGETDQGSQILIKAVAREAIGLAFKKFIKHYRALPATDQKGHEASTNAQDTLNPSAPADAGKPPTQTGTVASKALSPTSKKSGTKKLSKAQLAAQKIDLEREDRLRQIGQELQQARQARFLSRQQLHRQTLVPLAHLEALETGHIEQLPEDVFVRGFIRRLANALGLDAAGMVASLPAPDPVKSVVPSWQRPLTESGMQLRTGHLYVGYTALMASAVGGLSWMSGQATPGAIAEPDPAALSPKTVSESIQPAEPTATPGLTSGKNRVAAGSDIAPPEALAF